MLVGKDGHLKLTDFGLSKVELDHGMLWFLVAMWGPEFKRKRIFVSEVKFCFAN